MDLWPFDSGEEFSGGGMTPEEKAAQDAEEADHKQQVLDKLAVNPNSSQLVGSYGWRKDLGMESSPMRWDQTNLERTAQQQQNFQLGGYAGYANDAAAAARGAVDPYAGAMSYMGADMYGRGELGNTSYGIGTAGLYGQAGALSQYAQQGPGPSVAQANLAANNALAQRQNLALAGSGRGQGGGAAAMRQAVTQNALMGGQANGQAAMLGAQEAQDWRQAQLQAMGQAGALYGQGAGQGADYSQAMGNLGINAQQGAGNLALGGEQLVNNIYGTALGGSQAYEQNLTDIYGIGKGVPKTGDQGMTTKDWVGLGLQTAGTIGSISSDVRMKENIKPASALGALSDYGLGDAIKNQPLPDFGLADAMSRNGPPQTPASDVQAEKDSERRRAAWQSLAGYGANMMSDVKNKQQIQPASTLDAMRDVSTSTYTYKDPGLYGQGEHIGPMAQELEALPGVVKNTAQGKQVDAGRLTMANTSALAELNRKVDALAGGTPSEFNPYVDTSVAPSQPVQDALYSFGRVAPSAEQIATTREGLRNRLGDSAAAEFDGYANALLDERTAPPATPRRAAKTSVDTSVAPSAVVQGALSAYGSTPPNDAQIAKTREAIRAKYGSGEANQFERYAMAMRPGRGELSRSDSPSAVRTPGRPIVEFGPAEIESAQPRYNVEIGPAQIEDRPPAAAAALTPDFLPIRSPRLGRTIPTQEQNAGALYGPPVANAPSQAEQDEIERQFYDPTERYRTWAL